MRFLILLVIIAAAAFAGGRWMVTSANPEVAFWSQLNKQRDSELDALRASNPGQGLVIFTGGSSCAFSVDPVEIETLVGRPSYNLGGVAGAGAGFLIHEAFKRCQPGDILVLALEPHFLTEEGRSRPTQLGLALALDAGDRNGAAGGTTFRKDVSLREEANLLRPGARYFATWCAKLATGGLDYRYTMKDLRPGGRLETPGTVESLFSVALPKRELTEEGIRILDESVKMGAMKGVEVYYSLPWRYSNFEVADHNRVINESLIKEVNAKIPVLRDANLGISTQREHFSDSEYHLTEKGATERSRAIASGLEYVWISRLGK